MPPIYPSRSRRVAARMLGSEMMIMSPVDATLFSLNEVGSAIWLAADGSTPLDEIADRICGEFDVTPEAALQDADAFLRELAAHGIMHISECPRTEPL